MKAGTEAPRNASARVRLRSSSALVIVLAAIMTGLLVLLAFRLDCMWEVGGAGSYAISERTRQLLSETQGRVSATCYFDRNHDRFPVVSRILRGLEAASRSVAGVELSLRFADPHWDFSRATALASRDIPVNTAVFEVAGRALTVSLDSASDFSRGVDARNFELQCALAIAQLGQPRNSARIFWSQGHGEPDIDTYDEECGFSSLARRIRRAGFTLESLRLPGLREIPAACSVLVVAGAVKPFAQAELSLIHGYLMRGGRLLCLLPPSGHSSGIESELKRWGVEISECVGVTPRTYTGADTVCVDFADHPVVKGLQDSAVVFAAPRCLRSIPLEDPISVVALVSTGAEGWGESDPSVFPRSFSAQEDLPGPVPLSLAVERGGNVASDVSFDPARLVVVGECAFVQNGMLHARAHSNAELVVNALSWLAGHETIASSCAPAADCIFPVGIRARVLAVSVAAIPILTLSAFLLLAMIRRRRT